MPAGQDPWERQVVEVEAFFGGARLLLTTTHLFPMAGFGTTDF